MKIRKYKKLIIGLAASSLLIPVVAVATVACSKTSDDSTPQSPSTSTTTTYANEISTAINNKLGSGKSIVLDSTSATAKLTAADAINTTNLSATITAVQQAIINYVTQNKITSVPTIQSSSTTTTNANTQTQSSGTTSNSTSGTSSNSSTSGSTSNTTTITPNDITISTASSSKSLTLNSNNTLNAYITYNNKQSTVAVVISGFASTSTNGDKNQNTGSTNGKDQTPSNSGTGGTTGTGDKNQNTGSTNGKDQTPSNSGTGGTTGTGDKNQNTGSTPTPTPSTTSFNPSTFLNELNSNNSTLNLASQTVNNTSLQEIMQEAFANSLANFNKLFNFNTASADTPTTTATLALTSSSTFNQAAVPNIRNILISTLKQNLSSFKNSNLTETQLNDLQVVGAVPYFTNQYSVTKDATNKTISISMTPALVLLMTFSNLNNKYTVNGENVQIPQLMPLEITGFKPINIQTIPDTFSQGLQFSGTFISGIMNKYTSLEQSMLSISTAAAVSDNASQPAKNLLSLVNSINSNNLNKINSAISGASTLNNDLEVANIKSSTSLQPVSSTSKNSYTQKISSDLTTYLQNLVNANKDTTFKSISLTSEQIQNLKVYYSSVTGMNLNKMFSSGSTPIPTSIPQGYTTTSTPGGISVTFSPTVTSYLTDGGNSVSVTLNGVQFILPATQKIVWSGFNQYTSSDSAQAQQAIQSADQNALQPFFVNGSSAFVSLIKGISASIATTTSGILKQVLQDVEANQAA